MDIIKAYQTICGSDNPYRAYEIVNLLERQGLKISKSAYHDLVPKSLHHAIRPLLQQILLRSARRRIMVPLIKSCAGSEEPHPFPLPHQWLEHIEKEGVAVDYKKSHKAFFIEQCRAWGRSFKTTLKNIKYAFTSYNIDSDYVMYPDLSQNACVQENARYNFVRWLHDNDEHPDNKTLCVTSRQTFDSKNVRYCPYIFPRLQPPACIGFIMEILYLYSIGFIKWMIGHWETPFLMPEIITHRYFKRVRNIADRYAFNNSSHAIRPLWTYDAEQRGSEIILYFYSGNTNVFYKGQDKDSPPTPGYISMTWPNYWVLDVHLERFLTHQCAITANIDIKGYLDFTDSGHPIPDNHRPIIALFDIPIYNQDYIASLGVIAPFYTHSIISKFIDDIIQSATKNDFQVYWKTKRDMSGNSNITDYSNLIKKYDGHSHVTFINPEISAKRLMDQADIGIAIPFTSALSSCEDKTKPLYYYDPTGTLGYFKGLARELPVLQNILDLNNALSAFNKDKI